MTTDDSMTTDDEAAAASVADELRGLIEDFFRAVSFGTGARPPYHRLRDVFVAGGRLIKNSGNAPEISTVDEFIEPRQKLVDSGELTSFEEAESAEITEVFGNIAHRLSTYTKHGVTNGVPFDGQGVISTQFVRTPHGWKISSMAWDDERPGLVIPDRYR
jgi:hypothetical protein